MQLPSDAFSCRFVRGRIVPRWLTEDDHDFVASVLETIASFDGLTVAEAELVAERFFPNRIAEGIWQVERRRWTTALDAPVAPKVIRAVVFEAAASAPRLEALEAAAEELGLPVAMVEPSLFADRASRRRLCAAEPPTVDDVVARFNLAMVQTLLARAMDVDALFAGDPHPIVRSANRVGLIVHVVAAGDDRVRIQLAGPLSLFHETAKYGRSLARFVPAMVGAPGWSLRATVVVGGQRGELVLSEADGVAFAGSIAAAATDPVARRLARDLHKGGVRVNLMPPILRMGERLIVTDFALEWDDRRVYVDVMPFATAEQLDAKLALLARLEVPVLVCVGERSIGDRTSPLIVPYRRAIDAWRLLAAARDAIKENAA